MNVSYALTILLFPPPTSSLHHLIHGVTVANQLSAKSVKKLAPFTVVGLAAFVTLHLPCKLPAASTFAPTKST
jgi:hypothetical protein